MPLFAEPEMVDFRPQVEQATDWFRGEPRRTIEDADKLVAAVMQRLAKGFASERSGLEKQWDRGDDVGYDPAGDVRQDRHVMSSEGKSFGW
jgi:hypothetical protein